MIDFDVWSIGQYVRVLISDKPDAITRPDDATWIPAHTIQQLLVYNGLVLCVTADNQRGWPAGAYKDDFDANEARLRLVRSLAGVQEAEPVE
ncbi:hypothetical protein V0R37_15045 [Pollutimonas sp. H1-120]|uniref:hypothetical protein n=1 Tax=Pollutimonas sp. H1-120 TaxID=3148824 RepID=UPI003B5212EF